MTDSMICREIRQWLDQNGAGMETLDTRAGLGRGYTCKALRYGHPVGRHAFAKLATVIVFSPECAAEAERNYSRARAACRTNTPFEGERKPWPATVAELIAAKPIYARAWG